MSVRAPGYELTIAGRRWTGQLLALDVRLAAAPVPDILEARFPWAADVRAAPGDEVSLRLDGGDGAADVFHGKVDALLDRLDGHRLVAADAGGALARYRPAATFEQATAASVVRALCDGAGVDVGRVDDGVQLAYYAAEPTRTAWEHVARLAGWGGAIGVVSADGRVETVVPNTASTDVALRHGRDVVSLQRRAGSTPVATVVVAGESGVGSADDPDALRPATDFFGGSRPDGPDADTAWVFEPALRTAGAARTAADARHARLVADSRRWRLEALLRPDLRAGSVVHIADLPDGLPASLFVARTVRHQVAPWSVLTTAELVEAGGGGGGAGGLLAAAAAAVGL